MPYFRKKQCHKKHNWNPKKNNHNDWQHMQRLTR